MNIKKCTALFVVVMATAVAVCQEKVPPYLVVENIDDEDYGIHGKVVMGVTDPAEVPAHMKIPNGIVAIDDCAFEDCTSLASVVIPRSVTKIDSRAFSKCSPNLKIQYDGTKSQWNAISKGGNSVYSILQTIGTFIVQCTDGVVTQK